MLNLLKKAPLALFIGMILMLPQYAQANENNNYTTVKGTLSFEIEKPLNLGYVVDGAVETFATTKVGTDGAFAFTIPVAKEGFYYIETPDRSVRLYLSGGLDFQIEITEEGYTLSGDKLGHNRLLKEWNKTATDIQGYNKMSVHKTYKDFFPFFQDTVLRAKEAFLSKINTDDSRFNELMKLAVQADVEQGALKFLYMPRSEHPSSEQYIPFYKDLKKEGREFANEAILQLGNGFAWMRFYATFYSMEINKNDEVSGYLNRIASHLNYVVNDEIKEVYIRKNLAGRELSLTAYEQFMEPRRKYMDSPKSKEFLVQIEKEMKSKQGQPGFDFTYKNIDGESVSFSDFEGSYVYIDMWATWCAPCIEEIPHLKDLEEQFKDEEITFVSISIDAVEDKEKWKEFVKEESLGGVQLFADNAWDSGIVKNYEIRGIPRFLLFDKQGNIIDPDAMRPSNPELEKQFQSLLGNDAE